MNEFELEAAKLTAMLAATEQWPAIYSKAPEQHAQLLQNEAELQIILQKIFRNMAKMAGNFVNWDQYHYQAQLDFNVEVIVNDQQIDNWDTTFIKLTLKTVNRLIVAGVLAGQTIYKIPLGIPTTAELIQDLSTDEVAKLVGKKVLPDGSIVDNPNAEYNVIDTVRKDIAASVKTSLGVGETTEEAIERMQTIIAEPTRAALIAQTESVNAFNAGLMQYGALSNAVGKQWMTAGATDICATNAADGPIPIDAIFSGGVSRPAQHPRCRCGLRLIHQEEWDNIQNK